MILAAIDTTGEALNLAISSGGKPRTHRERASGDIDERLVPGLEKLLAKAGVKKEDVEAYAAPSGPGRFTGIRVGMTFVGVLARVHRRPVVAISWLEAAFRRAWRAGARGSLLVVLPAPRDEFYLQPFSAGAAGATKIGVPIWVSFAELAPAVKAAGGKALFVGPGAAALAARLGRKAVPEEPPLTAADILEPALDRLARNDAGDFSPLYLKPAGYERKK